MAFRGEDIATQEAGTQRKHVSHAPHHERSPFGRGRVPPVTEVVHMLQSSPRMAFELNEMLLNASGAGDTRRVLAMLCLGADVNVRDSEGRTPLMQALRMGYPEVADVLRAHGATE
jgi:ankyrin repeat protein